MTLAETPMVFLDLETTGATATRDRITEIGLVTISQSGLTRYSQLVNPECRIPDFIQGLTGITNEMVVDAPRFAELAGDLFERLEGKLFIAHNARFDYGFIKNEFKRIGINFRARVLCTVKLSRYLYPQETRHNLDALISRHGLIQSGRHRALADADLIFQFWKKLQENFSLEELYAAIDTLTARPSIPSQLDPDLPDQLPESHGVYIFYGDNNFPLYVGKSKNLRKRVMSHFSSDHARGKEMSISLQIRRVDWIETSGEISSLLKESALVKALMPSHNSRLRRHKELCAWQIKNEYQEGCETDLSGQGGSNDQRHPTLAPPTLIWGRDLNLGAQPDLYGIFRCQRDALAMLSELAQTAQCCKVLLGLEKAQPRSACFGFQLKQCRGACIGKEPVGHHQARLMMALARHKLPVWPYQQPIGLREGDTVHIIDAWCYLGAAQREDEIFDILDSGQPIFDLDVYKILQKAMRTLDLVKL